MAKLQLEIVTPDRLFCKEDVDMVIVRGIEGDLAILKDRTPITTPLKIGKLRIFKDDEERIAPVVNGYVTVLDNKITIVTDAAEWPHEIDVERAERAKERAEYRIQYRKDADLDRAEAALKRAINRLEATKL